LHLLGLVVALVAGTGCGGKGRLPDAPPERIENPGLGIAFESLPPDFTLGHNEGESLMLLPVGLKGRVEVRVGPRVGAVNLIAEIKDQQETIEARDAGSFLGQTELVGPLGTVYFTRGRYRDDGGTEVEEYTAIGLHPAGDRALYLSYRYPAGDDTKARGEALLELIGELGPLESSAAEPAAASGTPPDESR